MLKRSRQIFEFVFSSSKISTWDKFVKFSSRRPVFLLWNFENKDERRTSFSALLFSHYRQTFLKLFRRVRAVSDSNFLFERFGVVKFRRPSSQSFNENLKQDENKIMKFFVSNCFSFDELCNFSSREIFAGLFHNLTVLRRSVRTECAGR